MSKREMTVRRDPVLESFFAPMGAMSRMWDEWFGNGGSELGRVYRPSVDVSETENSLSVAFDLPGLKKEDVSITVEDGVLTVSGEKKFESEQKDKTWHRIERSYGRFHRSLALPSGVDPSKADAKFEDGVLTVEFPKTEAAKPKKITIH